MKFILLFSVLLIGTVNARSTWAYPKLECKKNETFELYAKEIEPSCENPNPESGCCKYSVCRCDSNSGFLRNTITGECVKGTDCDPPVCGENELIDPCTLGCEPSCDNPEPTNCTQKCVSGCQCNKGFLRRGDNKCVRETQCELPPKCPENEHWQDCYKSCEERNCTFRNTDADHEKTWGYCFLSPCTKGCSCDWGFFRNYEGRCVKEADCRPPGFECKENETFKECKSSCEASCRRPNTLICSNKCKTGCQCKDGLLRNPQGKCVKEEDCPYDDPKDKCKSLDCRLENQCFVHEGKPVCIPSYDLDICFRFPCPIGSKCKIVNDRPRCLAKVWDNNRSGTSEECDEVSYASETNHTTKPLCYEIGGNGALFSFTDVCYVTPCPEESTYVIHVANCTEPSCDPITKLASLEAQALRSQQCKQKNEIFATCKKSCSDTKCNEEPEMCTEECNGSGCVCQKGFFRDRFGDCVTQGDCDIQKEHMEWILKESAD